MISHLYRVLLISATFATVTHVIQSHDPIWDVGVRFNTVHIQVGDIVEWYTAVPFHTVFLGQQSATVDAAQIATQCQIASIIPPSFIQISPDPVDACANYPVCSFVSGYPSCLETVTVPSPTIGVCTTAVANHVPQIVRIRHQFTAPGTYYSVCTRTDPDEPVGSHCLTGMHAEIVVAGLNRDPERTPALFQLTLAAGTWGIARYHDINVVQGDKVQFVINRHEHDLQHVVITDTDESVDCSQAVTASTTLVAQTDGVADNDAHTFDWLADTPGTHLFWCSQGPVFHCQFGMHFRVTVNPRGH